MGRLLVLLEHRYKFRKHPLLGKLQGLLLTYLIHLFQEMIEQGLDFHVVTTDGEYMEIDTEEDYALANASWSTEATRNVDD